MLEPMEGSRDYEIRMTFRTPGNQLLNATERKQPTLLDSSNSEI
jgi:hypothetical protein